jgi:hypothetical protein
MTVDFVNFSSIPIYHIFSVVPSSMRTRERGVPGIPPHLTVFKMSEDEYDYSSVFSAPGWSIK